MTKDTRATAEDLEVSGFFWVPSFEIYGSVAGIYDLGPTGCAIERNFLQKWRDHFVLEDDMLEVRCSALTPRPVLDASGHTEKFNDLMLTDMTTKALYRADQYIAAYLKERAEKETDHDKKKQYEKDAEDVDGMTKEQMMALMAKYNIKSPEGNEFSEPAPFNLMFNTRVGPGARSIEAFLRPETAQGIFVNFTRLLNANRGSLPFAAAQVGAGYRNEISPRNGLVRCREFQMAEIEHFADPEQLNNFPKFETVKNLKVKLFPASIQELEDEEKRIPIEITLEDAIAQHVVSHKTLGYYIGRVYLFLCEIGIQPDTIRFRMHRKNEMAHYARECWDAEIYTKTLGWLECVGIADRQSWDLSRHAKYTTKKGDAESSPLYLSAPLDTPIHQTKVEGEKSAIGKIFRKDAKEIMDALATIPADQVEALRVKVAEAEKLFGAEKPAKKNIAKAIAALSAEDKKKFEELTNITVCGDKTVTYEMYNINDTVVTTRKFFPNVIEPSFGVGRIMTCLFEQAFYVREDGERRVLRLKPFMAPYKVNLIPINKKNAKDEDIHNIRTNLRKKGLANTIDAAGVSIGKRYARSDEIGTPFCITMDDVTNEDGTVTLRERDSTKQVRGKLDQIINAICEMVDGKSWEDATKGYETVTRPEN